MSFFTFGFGHSCPCGRSLANCYTELDDVDGVSARERMFELWGPRWSMQYDSAAQLKADEWRLTRVETNADDPTRCRCGASAAVVDQVEAEKLPQSDFRSCEHIANDERFDAYLLIEGPRKGFLPDMLGAQLCTRCVAEIREHVRAKTRSRAPTEVAP